MARVLIVGILALLFLQLAAGQSAACVDALNVLAENTASCITPSHIICNGSCRQCYDAVINNCDETVSQVAILCKISCLCARLAIIRLVCTYVYHQN